MSVVIQNTISNVSISEVAQSITISQSDNDVTVSSSGEAITILSSPTSVSVAQSETAVNISEIVEQVEFATMGVQGVMGAPGLPGGSSMTEWDDGDAVDTDSQGALLIGATGIPGTARAVKVRNDGVLEVDVVASVLPTSASTESTSAAILTELQGKADLTETQPVSASVLPLPTGAATAAAQLPDNHQVTVSNASLAVTASSLPLPSGAATAGNQSTMIGHVDGIEALLSTIDADTSTMATVDYATQSTSAAILTELQNKADLTETQPVSATSLPLPSGASTETTLAALNAKITAADTGAVVVSSGSITEANSAAILAAQLPDNHQVTVSNASLAVTAASLPLPTGAATSANQATVIGHVDGIEGLLGTIDADTSTLAAVDYATQATSAAILTELQGKADLTDTQPVSAATLPLPTGAATEATLATLNAKVTAVDTGAVVVASGAITETNSASILAAQLPDNHQVTVSNASLVVDEQPSAWGTQSQSVVSVGTTSTTVAASNANRAFVVIRNRTNSEVYLNLSGGAATTNGFRLDLKGDGVKISGYAYTGAITGITSAASAKDVEVWEVDR